MGENTRNEAPRTMDRVAPGMVWTNGAGAIPESWCCQRCHTYRDHDNCQRANTLGTKPCQCDCPRAEQARSDWRELWLLVDGEGS